MTDGITIVPEYAKLDTRLMKLAAALGNTSPMLEEIGIAGERAVKVNFKSGGRPDKWRISARARKQGGQTLMDTGNLRGSVSHEIEGRAVLVGSNVKYGPVHHFGATITAKRAKFLRFKTPDGFVTTKSVTIPARPWLVLSPKSFGRFNEVIRTHVEKS